MIFLVQLVNTWRFYGDLPLFIKQLSYKNHTRSSERSCIYVIEVSILSLLRLIDYIMELFPQCGIIFFRFFHFETDYFETDHFKVDYSLNWSDQRHVTSISNEIGIIRERTKTVSIQCIMYIWQLIWLFEIHIMQTVHGTEGHMAVYGTICHLQNIIKTEAKLRSI